MPIAFIVIFPFIAAMCYGLGYVLIEKVVGVHINTATFFAINTAVCIPVLLAVMCWKNQSLDFSPVFANWPVLLLVLAAALAPCLGWVFSIFAIRHTSALFTAFAETSYPIFTMAFGFLIFGTRHLNLMTFLGGLLVLLGAVIMIYGQNSAVGDE